VKASSDRTLIISISSRSRQTQRVDFRQVRRSNRGVRREFVLRAMCSLEVGRGASPASAGHPGTRVASRRFHCGPLRCAPAHRWGCETFALHRMSGHPETGDAGQASPPMERASASCGRSLCWTGRSGRSWLVLDEPDWPVWLGEAPGDPAALLEQGVDDILVSRTVHGRSSWAPTARAGNAARV